MLCGRYTGGRAFQKSRPDGVNNVRGSLLEVLVSESEAYPPYQLGKVVALSVELNRFGRSVPSKAVAFDHVKRVLNPGAVIFGSTILQGGVPRSWLARGLMGVYNKKGIFSNAEDGLEALELALNQRFSDVVVTTEGCVALFSARLR